MTLYDLKAGKTAYVDKLLQNDLLSQRLIALGCIKGTEIKVVRVAPLGDPIIVNLRGYNLAIRKKEAKNIIVREEARINAYSKNA